MFKLIEYDDGRRAVARELTDPGYGQMCAADTHGRQKVMMADMPIIANAFRIDAACGHFCVFTYDPFTDPNVTHFGG